MPGLRQLSARFILGCALLMGLAFPLATIAQELSDSHPKYITARKVFEDLVRAIGDGRTAPDLRIVASGSGGGMKVAWYSPKTNRLTIEEKTFDLAVSMGADSLNALAALIGHELAHFYKDHGWGGDFGNGFADLEIGRRVQILEQSDEQIAKYESEADYFGGFFGYLAQGGLPKCFSRLVASANDIQAFALMRAIVAVDQEAAVTGVADEAEFDCEENLRGGRRGAGHRLGRYHRRGAGTNTR